MSHCKILRARMRILLRRHRSLLWAGAASGLFYLVCLHLLPYCFSAHYLPSLWRRCGLGNIRCEVEGLGLGTVRLRNVLLWDGHNGEARIDHCTLGYGFRPWSTESLVTLREITLEGLHACVVYTDGRFEVMGLEHRNLSRLHLLRGRDADRLPGLPDRLEVKNSDLTLYFASRRLHVPFSCISTFQAAKKEYQLFGYVAPRGEYTFLSGGCAPWRKRLSLQIKGEQLNLGCFNDFLPEEIARQNVVGNLFGSLVLDLRRRRLAGFQGRILAGLPQSSAPSSDVTWELSPARDGGQLLKAEGSVRTSRGRHLFHADGLALSFSLPYLKCSGEARTEFHPVDRLATNLILPSEMAFRHRIRGRCSACTFKWELHSSSEARDGLTACHLGWGRFGSGRILADLDLQGGPKQPLRIGGSVTMPRVFLQNRRKQWELNGIRAEILQAGGREVRLALSGKTATFTAPRYRLDADSWRSRVTLFSPGHDCLLSGEVSRLRQGYEGHEFTCPALGVELCRYPGNSSVSLNLRSDGAALSSAGGRYAADGLRFNWNWLFNPNDEDIAESSASFLRCPRLRLPGDKTASLDMRCTQHGTTACCSGVLAVDSDTMGHDLDFTADLHWPLWKQLPFLRLRADFPPAVLEDIPALRDLVPAQHDRETDGADLISFWLDGTWFNGRLQTRSGCGLKTGIRTQDTQACAPRDRNPLGFASRQ